eukprot:3004886-Prymnesium_polylepis.1
MRHRVTLLYGHSGLCRIRHETVTELSEGRCRTPARACNTLYGTSWLRGRSSPVPLKSANWSSFKLREDLVLLGRNAAAAPRGSCECDPATHECECRCPVGFKPPFCAENSCFEQCNGPKHGECVLSHCVCTSRWRGLGCLAAVYHRACGTPAPLLHLDRQLPQVKGFLDMTVTYIVSRESGRTCCRPTSSTCTRFRTASRPWWANPFSG